MKPGRRSPTLAGGAPGRCGIYSVQPRWSLVLDLVAAWRRERPGRRRWAWRRRPSWPKRRLLLVNGPLVFCRRTHPVAKLNTKKLRTMTATSSRLYGRAALITIKAVKPPNISYRRSPNSCGVHATKETIGKVNRKRTTLQFGAPSKASTSPAAFCTHGNCSKCSHHPRKKRVRGGGGWYAEKNGFDAAGWRAYLAGGEACT